MRAGQALSAALVLAWCVPAGRALAYAEIVIDVADDSDEGFDDPTVVTPVGGNDGTTLGEQRLIALQHAADLWGQVLDSAVPIVVEATFESFGCNPGASVTGGRASTAAWEGGITGDGADPSLVYPRALAERLDGVDLAPGEPDIYAYFNSDIDDPSCLGSAWYYGLDGDAGDRPDFVHVALHELGHGLGVTHAVDPDTGVLAFGSVLDAFSAHVYDGAQGKAWSEMDDDERRASFYSLRALVWDGPNVTEAAAGFLLPGAPTLQTTPVLPTLSGLVSDSAWGARPADMSVSADLVVGDPIDGCTTPVAPVAGAIVLLRPACTPSAVARILELRGAVGLLMVRDLGWDAPPAPLDGESDPEVVGIPALGISEADAQILEAAAALDPITVHISGDPARLLGADAQGRVYLNAVTPGPGQVSHWESSARPNLLMEPLADEPLTQDVDLSAAMMVDLGWTPFCGNGRLDQEEECDDADENDDETPDACRTSCRDASCGDAVVDTGEECDDGADNSDTLPGACRVDCTAARCGDGVVDDGEGCDDGADNDDAAADACRADCTPPFCGDGVVDTGEACDEGAGNSDTAADACRADCSEPACGDGVVDTGEACDDGDANSNSAPNVCRTDCAAPSCGDHVVDEGEQCDDGVANGDGPTAACRADCTPARCGDGVTNGDEACDDGAGNSDDAPNACRTDCSAARCGDGVVDQGEQCDGSDGCSAQCLLPGFMRTPDGGIAEQGGSDGGDEGCGCRVPGAGGARGRHGVAGLVLLLLALGVRSRRRRPRSSGRLRAGHVLPLLGLAVVICAAPVGQGCSTDKSGPGRQSGAPRGGAQAGGDSDGPPTDGGTTPSAFGNSDAGVPDFTLPDGGFPDGAAALRDADPDDDSCGSVELEPMVNRLVEPGNLLVVFDNSGSMSSAWGTTPRWLAAGNALRDAVSSLSEYLTVAAIIFPTPTGGCVVPSVDSDEQIRWLPGPTFIAAWDNFMAQNAPGGGTPLGGGLMAADVALQMSTRTGITNVIVLTDGAPGCDTTPLTTLPPMWLAQGVKTHVVGLPGSESAVTVLDNIAMGGGTMQHLTPDDPRALRRQLAGIISETVTSALESCTIPLDPPAPNPDDVHVVVTEGGQRQAADRDLGEGGGWTIDDEGTEITFFGTFCDKGLAGEYDRIGIEFGCVDLPPLEPPVLD